jgi:hypothetical protein
VAIFFEGQFAIKLVARAAKNSFSALGTNALGWLVSSLFLSAILLVLQMQGAPSPKLTYLKAHWKREVWFPFVAATAIWLVVFSYEAVFGIPHQIRADAAALMSPSAPCPPPAPEKAFVIPAPPPSTERFRATERLTTLPEDLGGNCELHLDSAAELEMIGPRTPGQVTLAMTNAPMKFPARE